MLMFQTEEANMKLQATLLVNVLGTSIIVEFLFYNVKVQFPKNAFLMANKKKSRKNYSNSFSCY